MNAALSSSQTNAWYVAVPSNAEFTEPRFHFGERVSWLLETQENSYRLTGRITGLWFSSGNWNYDIDLDLEKISEIELEEFIYLEEQELELVHDECTLRDQQNPLCEWFPTRQAARRLGLRPAQLRHLRQHGKFTVGYHCRDASIPGSRKPLWQWHIERCHKTLAAQT